MLLWMHVTANYRDWISFVVRLDAGLETMSSFPGIESQMPSEFETGIPDT